MHPFDLKVMDVLLYMDSTVPQLCEQLKADAEDVVRSLKKMSVYGHIDKNLKVMFYGKAGDVWFTIARRPRRT